MRLSCLGFLQLIGPGVLVAATGVGAGDLLTASMAGSALGVSILWAALAGAVLKWFLNEGIARWQMATGTSILEGWAQRLGGWIKWVFLAYLLLWTFFTGGALVSACGVAGHGLLPLSSDPHTSKILWGLIHSLAGVVLVLAGGFGLFERVMGACTALMFVTVLATAALSEPDLVAVGRGLVIPEIPAGGEAWVLGVLGGVGGTVTLLSYGYWIREKGRQGKEGLRQCRLDLAVAYGLTAVFGLCMVIVGSRVEVTGQGATVALTLAQELERVAGPWGRWIFLLGFWGAVFTSLLGVWQSVPYMFADFWTLWRSKAGQRKPAHDLARTPVYRGFLVFMAAVSVPMLFASVQQAQLAYAVLGSFFMPLLALTLLIMNSHPAWVSREFRSSWLFNAVLVGTLGFFLYLGVSEAIENLRRLAGG
jgi:Mn2+/Fe2+ NRAMP family transporter